MKALFERVRAEFATTSHVRQAVDRWQELSPEYDRHPCHSPERRAVGAEIAGCLAVIADGIEASRLASWVGFLGDPENVREGMEFWRAGDCHDGEVCPHE